VIDESHFTQIPDRAILHLPCPAFWEENFKERLLEKFGKKIQLFYKLPSCCGAGGGAHVNPELSSAFLEKALHQSKDKPLLTFCFGCKNRFVKKGSEAYHLLETLTGVKPLRKGVSSTKKWLNRLIFAFSRKFFFILKAFFFFYFCYWFS